MVTNLVKVRNKVAKVLIVDRHPVTREGLAVRLGAEPDVEVCGEAADVLAAQQLIEATGPDLVLIDISLRNGDGLELVKRLKARNSPAKVLVWSMYSDSLYAERALRAGALGYVNKEEPTDT